MVRVAKSFLFRFLAILTVSLPLVHGRAVIEPRALPPDLDPFYDPPSGFESKEPGTILRKRPVVSSFFGLIPNPVETWQLLYRTTAIDGSPIATVTTVFKPLAAKKDRFISFHTAYDSSATICNPSYNYRLGSVQVSLISSVEFLLLQAYLLSGFIVASPDYEGPDAAFTPGRLEGMGVLDGMRAVANFKDTLDFETKSPMIVGTGYSGGAIATGWAASLHPTYAPELDVKGWAHGGTPSNLTGTLEFIDGTLFSGFLPAAIEGLLKPSAYEAELKPLLDEVATEKGRDALDFTSENCAVANLIAFPNQSVLSTDFQSLGPDLLYQPDVAAVLEQNTMGVYKNETPTAPVFMYHAEEDEIVPYKDASVLSDAWCKNGATVKFTTFANGGHATTEPLALLASLDFAKQAFDGKVPEGCSKDTELADDLNPISLGVQLEPLLIKLIEALAVAGKRDEKIMARLETLQKTV